MILIGILSFGFPYVVYTLSRQMFVPHSQWIRWNGFYTVEKERCYTFNDILHGIHDTSIRFAFSRNINKSTQNMTNHSPAISSRWLQTRCDKSGSIIQIGINYSHRNRQRISAHNRLKRDFFFAKKKTNWGWKQEEKKKKNGKDYFY